jgi:hypothetical protein
MLETSRGNLLLVRRLFDSWPFEPRGQGMTGCFEVYKLELDDESGRMVERVEVKNIGDGALFLGGNQSTSVLTSHFFTHAQRESQQKKKKKAKSIYE